MKLIMLLAFSCLLFMTTSSYATGFTPIVNNLAGGGHACGAITHDDYTNFLIWQNQYNVEKDRFSKEKMQFTGYGHFVKYLYRKGVRQNQEKNKCLTDYSESVLDSEDAVNEIRRTMALVWLNKRKAELILNQCHMIHNEYSNQASRSVGQLGRSTPPTIDQLISLNPKIDPDFYETCMNKDTVSALQTLVVLSERSLPFLSSKELLSIMQDNRSFLVYKKAGRPITDKELLKLDLTPKQSNPAGPLFKFDAEGAPLINEAIRYYIKNKIDLNNEYQKELKENNYDEEHFKRLYDEGIIDEVLTKSNVTQATLQKNSGLDRMVSCMRSSNDASMIGTALDFMALFYLAKASVGKLKTIQNLPVALNNGFLATIASSSTIISSCLNKRQASEKFSGKAQDHRSNLHKDDLPNGVDLDLYTLSSIPIQSVPSCKNTQYDQVYLERLNLTSCIQETAMAVLPTKLGFYFMGLSMLDH